MTPRGFEWTLHLLVPYLLLNMTPKTPCIPLHNLSLPYLKSRNRTAHLYWCPHLYLRQLKKGQRLSYLHRPHPPADCYFHILEDLLKVIADPPPTILQPLENFQPHIWLAPPLLAPNNLLPTALVCPGIPTATAFAASATF